MGVEALRVSKGAMEQETVKRLSGMGEDPKLSKYDFSKEMRVSN